MNSSVELTSVSESAIRRFLHREKFSHKKLTKIASQRSEELREKFLIDCSVYKPEMLVFVDETECDRRSAMRKFGYLIFLSHLGVGGDSLIKELQLLVGARLAVLFFFFLNNKGREDSKPRK